MRRFAGDPQGYLALILCLKSQILSLIIFHEPQRASSRVCVYTYMCVCVLHVLLCFTYEENRAVAESVCGSLVVSSCLL